MDLPINLHLVALVTIIITTGATLQGSVGLGLGFVAVPLLALIYPDFLPGPLIMAAFFLTILMTKREHQAIQFKGITWAIGGRLLGSALGIQILLFLPKKELSSIFAVMIILAVLLSISGLRIPLNSKNLFGVGTLSGLMSVTAAIGGPPLALIYQYLKGPELRSTLSGIFVVGSLISISLLAVAGYFGWYEIKLTAVLLPGIIFGYFLSNRLSKVLDKGFIRPAVLIFSTLSAIMLIIKSLA